MTDCAHCQGLGSIAVELGSSQRYRCADCGGTGKTPVYDTGTLIGDRRTPEDIACDDGEPDDEE